LLVGSEKYVNSLKRKILVEGLLSKFVSFSFDDRCANVYARIRHDLERRGCVIGPYDLQISAIALAHPLTVVTGNVVEFSRVTGLRVEDWTFG
jgi:tRNA(fMet)-specific endonuclease VapC